MKKIGFLSFGHWHDSPQSQTRSASDALLQSVELAVLAAGCVIVVRLCEDYIVMPKILGDAVGLSPLLVLVSVTAVGILFSGWAVLFAVPLAAIIVTIFDVLFRDVDPAEEEVPTVIFSAKESEA